MGDYENFINEAVDDDKEATFSDIDKMQAFMVEQGIKSTLKQLSIDTNITSIKANTDKNQYDANGNHQVNLNTALSKDIDNIDVGKMSNGGTTLAHNAITATTTSTEIDCRGFKNVRVSCEVTAISSATWTPSITGSENSGGTFGSIYRDIAGTFTAYSMPAQSVIGKNIYVIQNIPNFIKITKTLS